LIFRGLFFEHNAEIGQKDYLWMDTSEEFIMPFIPYDLDEEKLKQIQIEGLQWTLNHVYDHSSFYRNKFDAAGIKPEDIQSLDDIELLPFTDKND